ncbi:glycosyltransferase family 2 protein [Gramella sp. GC03-9]|uniref:Glycosyltransferase family 2 protein n=1 Tax=Christiangramia oceanisediminis TaxID=2920386 RepID=A0A9X2R8S3_9FLAO|nr:glycosyltransferase family 2 protein [Gramella oceanisediminis]MCP9200512.1 glycosyltransferase family 2 protein [Gramella oceanisediminis]
MKYEFTIIVPVFNEQECLHELLGQLKAYLAKASKITRVLLVDDGSTDSSPQLIREFCSQNESFRYIIFERNFGKGAALKAAFDHIDTPLLGYLDADLQTYPQDFEKLLPFIGEYDLVTGWRRDRKDTLVKRISSKVGNGVRHFFTSDKMHDTGCPLKIMKTSFAKNIPMFKGLQRFLPAMVLLQNGKIKEVEIPHYPRLAGKSKYNFRNRFMGPLIDCFAYVWMKKSYIKYKIGDRNE